MEIIKINDSKYPLKPFCITFKTNKNLYLYHYVGVRSLFQFFNINDLIKISLDWIEKNNIEVLIFS